MNILLVNKYLSFYPSPHRASSSHLKNNSIREEFIDVMFVPQTQLNQITVQEHIPIKITLMSLTFTSHTFPTPTFKPNGLMVKFVGIPIIFMWLRATKILLWDIWYGTHNKWREELIGYFRSFFIILYGSLLTINLPWF